MHHLQPELFLKRIEIAVAVQQPMAGLQTKGGNQAIDGLADRITASPQFSIVMGGGDCQIGASGLKHLELQEFGVDSGKGVMVPNSLQYFAKDEVGQP